MRKLAVLACTAAVVVSVGAVTALAAVVRAGATYSGTAIDYLNNGPRWQTTATLHEKVSFAVSGDGRHVLNFVGHYAYYCGAGTSTITARSLVVAHHRFSGTGRHANANGVNYYSLSGVFGPRGTATVVYQDDFVYKGKHVADPYSYRYHPPALACESRATGTLTAAGGH